MFNRKKAGMDDTKGRKYERERECGRNPHVYVRCGKGEPIVGREEICFVKARGE